MNYFWSVEALLQRERLLSIKFVCIHFAVQYQNVDTFVFEKNLYHWINGMCLYHYFLASLYSAYHYRNWFCSRIFLNRLNTFTFISTCWILLCVELIDTRSSAGFLPYIDFQIEKITSNSLLTGSLTINQTVTFYTPVFRRDVLWYGAVRPSVRPSVRPTVSTKKHRCKWRIFFKFCTQVCLGVPSINLLFVLSYLIKYAHNSIISDFSIFGIHRVIF